MTLRLFIYKPEITRTALVNQASFDYPIDEVAADNFSTNHFPGGDWQAMLSEMTVWFYDGTSGDFLGRQRLRKASTSDTLFVGRSSQGRRDGELDLADNAVIKVANDYRVWAKIPYINPATDPPTIFKDSDLAAGTNVSQPPPVANAGVLAIGDIDSGSSVFRFQLPHEDNTSWAVASGATISSYTWSLPDGNWLVSTTNPTGATIYDDTQVDAAEIVVDQPAGIYFYGLEVEDSNGETHSAKVVAVARDPASPLDGFIDDFEIVSWEITPQGQKVSVRILEDIDADDYPDGTMVILYDGEPSSNTDRSNVLFWGWHQSDPQTIRSERTGIVKDVVLECVDVGGRLGILPGFPFIVGGDPAVFDGWAHMPNAEWRHFLTYHLNWHTNALDIADWLPSSDLANYAFPLRQTDAGNIYRQIDEQARSVCPDYQFTVNRFGQMLCRVDPMLQESGDRTSTVQVTLDGDDWREIQVTGTFWPHHHWLREEAIYASDYSYALTTFFSIAPGDSPGQGEGEAQPREHLAQSQDQLNETTGQRYGRLNAPQSFFRITLVGEDDFDIEPANMTWVQLTLPAAYAAQRGLTFTNARGLVHNVVKRYRYTRTGIVVEHTILWERETEGITGVTYTPPEPS